MSNISSKRFTFSLSNVWPCNTSCILPNMASALQHLIPVTIQKWQYLLTAYVKGLGRDRWNKWAQAQKRMDRREFALCNLIEENGRKSLILFFPCILCMIQSPTQIRGFHGNINDESKIHPFSVLRVCLMCPDELRSSVQKFIIYIWISYVNVSSNAS